MPDTNPPNWIELPLKAEYQLKLSISQRALQHLALLQGSQEDDYVSAAAAASADSPGSPLRGEESSGGFGATNTRQVMIDSMNTWIEKLHKTIVTPFQEKVSIIQQVLSHAQTATDSSALVIIRTLVREYQYGQKCLTQVLQDLQLLR